MYPYLAAENENTTLSIDIANTRHPNYNSADRRDSNQPSSLSSTQQIIQNALNHPAQAANDDDNEDASEQRQQHAENLDQEKQISEDKKTTRTKKSRQSYLSKNI